MIISKRVLLIPLLAALLPGCASLSHRDPLHVEVAGVEPLEGEGLEMRMMVKLRVQNPNEEPLSYNGVAMQMDVAGHTFASGVSDASGSVPRFGETVIEVPVSISAFRAARQALTLMHAGNARKIQYELKGKLSGGMRFSSKGEFSLPAAVSASN